MATDYRWATTANCFRYGGSSERRPYDECRECGEREETYFETPGGLRRMCLACKASEVIPVPLLTRWLNSDWKEEYAE